MAYSVAKKVTEYAMFLYGNIWYDMSRNSQTNHEGGGEANENVKVVGT